MVFGVNVRAPLWGSALVVAAIGAEAAPWARDSNNWVEFQPDGPGSVRRVGKSAPYFCFEDQHVAADHDGKTYQEKLAAEYAGFPDSATPFILRTLFRSWTSYDIALHLTTIVLEEFVAQRTVYVDANSYGMATREIMY